MHVTKATRRDIALVFLRLGLTAFGGPAAHVSFMQQELVRRRGWLTHERFLDLLGAANLIPGPSSTELALYIGYEQAGFVGLLLGGVCFILPAALMVAAIAWLYVRWSALPALGSVLYGVKPVVIGVVVQALWALTPKALKRSKLLGAIGVAAAVASALGLDAIVVLVTAGALSALTRAAEGARKTSSFVAFAMVGSASAPKSLLGLFLVFLKIGAVVFGSGYVLLAFLRADLVDRSHWLTERELLDAVAVGQLTPGPVFTTATFIGYLVARGPGAVVATVGIFLPGFVLVAATRSLVARVRRSAIAGAFLDGVNVASIALMAVVTAELARAAVVDVPTAGIAFVSAILLLRFRVSSTWLIAGAALVGLVARA